MDVRTRTCVVSVPVRARSKSQLLHIRRKVGIAGRLWDHRQWHHVWCGALGASHILGGWTHTETRIHDHALHVMQVRASVAGAWRNEALLHSSMSEPLLIRSAEQVLIPTSPSERNMQASSAIDVHRNSHAIKYELTQLRHQNEMYIEEGEALRNHTDASGIATINQSCVCVCVSLPRRGAGKSKACCDEAMPISDDGFGLRSTLFRC